MTNEGCGCGAGHFCGRKMGGRCSGTRIEALEIHPMSGEEGEEHSENHQKRKNRKENDSESQREKRQVICVTEQRGVVRHDGDGMFEFPRRLMRREFY